MRIKWNLYRLVGIFLLGSLLMGMNMAGVSGAVSFVRDIFVLDNMELGLVVSSIMVGCLLGVLIAWGLGESLRKEVVLLFAAIFFAVSALGSGAAQTIWHLITARIIGGMALGAVSFVVPTYLYQLMPASIRSFVGAIHHVGIVIGILIAYVINYAVVDMQDAWRYMLYSPLIFAIPFFLLSVIGLSASIRSLEVKEVGKGMVMKRPIHGAGEARKVSVIQKMYCSVPIEREHASFVGLFKGNMTRFMVVGSLLTVFHQVSGIHAMIFYAPTIFAKVGVGGDTALLQSIFLGVIYLVCSLGGVWLIDKVGSRQLLLWGEGGMMASLSYVTSAFCVDEGTGIGVFVAMLVYVAFFALFFASVVWMIISDIYPTKLRELTMFFSTLICWSCTLLVVQFFPFVLENLGGGFSFGLFLMLSVFAFVFTLIQIPKT
ncbi:MFS transporter [Saccharicrinis fermentans]|uniref:Putative metabolite transport protein CsbC n=1 Tax=Saccharicrinis fermentans DSM 9555 = JCM 21142 TaxID=869213 RepID=W7Y497_9BACT|nr:MFS transporter [Saccharicrinis fermentans]GAF02907.1 putative metabolite transport protein CsbC [Saccharicrinis fermentans DSM 9555 = JCM 21142]